MEEILRAITCSKMTIRQAFVLINKIVNYRQAKDLAASRGGQQMIADVDQEALYQTLN